MAEKSLSRTILELCVGKYPAGLTDDGAIEILSGISTVAGMCLARLSPVCFAAFVDAVNTARTKTIEEAERQKQMSGVRH